MAANQRQLKDKPRRITTIQTDKTRSAWALVRSNSMIQRAWEASMSVGPIQVDGSLEGTSLMKKRKSISSERMYTRSAFG